MTARERGAEDLVDAPFADDAERAETDWLIAREADPAARPPSAKIATEYAELEDLLANLREVPPDDSWHDDVWRIASSSVPVARPWWRRARVRWAMAGGFVAASAVVVWLLIPRAHAELEVAIRHGDPTRSDPTRSDPTRGDPDRGETVAAAGDHLIVTARPREPADLRVYRSKGALVARCPDGRGCRASAQGEYILEITLEEPGEYRVILVAGAVHTPLGDTMDDYLETARAAHARIITYQPISVR